MIGAPPVITTKFHSFSSVAETAVSMEDALIHGLLSTVNEDAQEDILTNEEKTLKKEGKDNEANIIYLGRTTEGAMSVSIGSEDAFCALERGRSIR